MKKILIVEDDASIVLGLESSLNLEGYETLSARTGPDGIRLAREAQPDLLILDSGLPGFSGFQICQRIRDEGNKAPIIMLTPLTDDGAKAFGLDSGADDYVPKPVSLSALLARVRLHLRRQEAAQPAESDSGPETYRFGKVEVNLRKGEVYREGQLQDFTSLEFRLLVYFIQHAGELLTRDRLLDEIWGYEVYPSTRTVDNHIMRLRKHIETDPGHPHFIKTIHGAGYLFDLECHC